MSDELAVHLPAGLWFCYSILAKLMLSYITWPSFLTTSTEWLETFCIWRWFIPTLYFCFQWTIFALQFIESGILWLALAVLSSRAGPRDIIADPSECFQSSILIPWIRFVDALASPESTLMIKSATFSNSYLASVSLIAWIRSFSYHPKSWQAG